MYVIDLYHKVYVESLSRGFQLAGALSMSNPVWLFPLFLTTQLLPNPLQMVYVIVP